MHVTAPSLAADDRVYRTLAQAYVDFEPATRVLLSPRSLPPHKTSSTPAQVPEHHISSPNLSFEGVLDNMGSPHLRHDGASQQFLADTGEGTWMPPPSTIQDSCPDEHIKITTLCSPTRVLEYLFQQRAEGAGALDDAQPPISSPRAGAESGPSNGPKILSESLLKVVGRTLPGHASQPSGNSKPGSSFSAHNAIIVAATPNVSRVQPPHSTPDTSGFVPATPYSSSVIPASPPVQQPTSKAIEISIHSSEVIPSSRPDNTNSPTPDIALSPKANFISSPRLDFVSSSRSGPEAPSRKRQRAQDNDTALCRSSSDAGPRQKRQRAEGNDKVLPRSTSDMGPHHTPTPVPDSLRYGSRVQALDNDLEIHSPEPTTAMDFADPTSIVTPPLVKIVKDMEMWRYEPEQTRDVRPFERGYWLLDTSDWDEAQHCRAWNFLSIKLPRGDAGWGTWCQRNSERTWLRVYCFGAITTHIYFVLYVASHPAIKRQGMSWHGGEGHPVITITPQGVSQLVV